MTAPELKRKAPYYTLGEMGLFPPFFQQRIDYANWLVARRYHLWIGVGMSAIVAIDALRISLSSAVPRGTYWASALAMLFIAMAAIYSRLRRALLMRKGRAFFEYRIQAVRTAVALVGVAFLHYGFDRLVPDTSLFVWLLYVPALAIASEHQPSNWSGLAATAVMMALAAGLLLLSPWLAGAFTPGALSWTLWLGRVVVVISVTLLIQYLVRNIQKRSLLFEEDREYAEQLIGALQHMNNPSQLWGTCLQICLRRLRAQHGSIWVRSPANGRSRLVMVMRRDGLRPDEAIADVTSEYSPIEIFDEPESGQHRNLIQAVVSERTALAWLVGNTKLTSTAWPKSAYSIMAGMIGRMTRRTAQEVRCVAPNRPG
ncbi:MAG: hypothetical protein ACRDH2_00770 [Anaerolineales bacterium]